MNEREAAAFLNLSERTLRNYRRKGKLPYREVKGKTRPVIEYNRADLEQLRAELEARRRRGKKSAMASSGATTSPRVTFGLPQTEFEELATEAAKYGFGVGEYARRLVREGLESRFQSEASELRVEMNRQKVAMQKIHREFAAAFELVLEFAGLSADEARKWVDENLR